MIRKTNIFFKTIRLFFSQRFFQNSSVAVDQLTLKLKSKAKEAFEQISRTTQTRLESDQTKVKRKFQRFDSNFFSGQNGRTTNKTNNSIVVR